MAFSSYKRAILKDAGGDLAKRWYIDYWVWDEAKNGYTKFREWIPSKIKTKRQRYAYGHDRVKAINSMLEGGWSPLVSDKPQNLSATNILDAIDFVVEQKSMLRSRSKQSHRAFNATFYRWIRQKKLHHLQIAHFRDHHARAFMQYVKNLPGIQEKRTINNYIHHFRSVWSCLVKNDYVQRNPFKRIEVYRLGKKQGRALGDAARDRMANYLQQADIRMWLFVCFLYYGFMRPKEIVGLRVEWVDLPGRRIFIPADLSKNGTDDSIVISDAWAPWVEMLELHRFPGNYFVFHQSLKTKAGEKPEWPTRASERHSEHRDKLQLPKSITLYSWKYQGIDDHIRAGIPLTDIQRQARHHSLEMLQIYAQSKGFLASDTLTKNAPNL